MRRRRYGLGIFLLLLLLVIAVRSSNRLGGQTLRERIQERRATAAEATLTPRGTASCGSTLNLGFHIKTFSTGLRAAVWYPATDAETRFQYADHLAASVARDAPAASCGQFPLVVFSHGFGGCGLQSVFFTESLARAGYIVVAPDHKDSRCKVDQPGSMGGGFFERPEEPFQRAGKWSDTTYLDRKDDIEVVLNEIMEDPLVGHRIDRNAIGGAGHSLGGYTIAGLSGAWPSWKDNRIRAALLLSPYIEPFLKSETMSSMKVPVMYQGGTRDRGITPKLEKAGGAYDSSNAPKFYVKFQDAGHFGWTNMTCHRSGTTEACKEKSPLARLINEYGIAFFDHYLKGKPEPILNRPNAELADMRQKD